MTTATVRNGVNVDQLIATVGAVKQDPALGRFQFRSTSRWQGGGRSASTIESFYGAGSEQQHTRQHVIEGDEPAVLLGGDAAPNAVETVLAALASCLSVGYAYNAAALGITIDELEFTIEGNLDLQGFLGLSDSVRPGFQDIRVSCRVKSDAPREKLLELGDYVQRTSPVLDVLRNPVSVSLELKD